MLDGDVTTPSLAQSLANALPKDFAFRFYHISTPPTRCAPLYSPPQGSKPERTYCERHFLNVSVTPAESVEELFVYAIEILVYSTRRLTTIFVSKADSTGYLPLLKLSKSHPSPLRSITTTFLSWLVQHRQRPGKKLVLSLFARAQDQYLFPGSVENPTKHVATDRGLVSWWCRVVDPLLHLSVASLNTNQIIEDEEKGKSQAYLIVPGSDSTASFLPLSVRSDPSLRKRWKEGHPLYSISSYPSAPPRCLVPHFPDDPKARFVDELDADLPDNVASGAPAGSQQDSPSKRGRGMWKSVKSLEQFWEMMAFRQECASGRLVGFLWVVFESSLPMPASQELAESQSSIASPPADDIETPTSPTRPSSESSMNHRKREKRQLKGPIVPRTPRVKSSASALSISSLPASSPYYAWPTSSRGSLILSEKDYKRVTDLLLKLDFANREIAAVGTRQWIDEVGVYADTHPWGFVVKGRMEPAATSGAGHEANGVTVLSVKRKAKAMEPVGGDSEPRTQPDEATVLGAGLIRKKAKVEVGTEAPQAHETTPAANNLAARLIRKKPKVG